MDVNVQIPLAFSAHSGKAMSGKTHFGLVFCTGRYFQVQVLSAESGDRNIRAKDGFAQFYLSLDEKIIAFDVINRAWKYFGLNLQIP